MRYRIILFFIVTFLLSFSKVSAGLVINEIMYDVEGTDTGREWIEIYNDSGSPVDFLTYKFFEADTNHGLTLSQGSGNISAHGYALIVSDPNLFKSDWPNFSGNIFDSSFSLGNAGESLAIKDANLNIVDEYTYNSNLGGMGDGKSLQLVNSSWVASTPTVGGANQISVEEPKEEEDFEEESSTPPKVVKNTVPDNTTSKVILKVPKVVFVNTPFELEAEAVDNNGKELKSGKYFWNFGDGNGEERKNSEIFSYSYPYEGDYHISLEYYLSNQSKTPDSSLQATVKVIPADISISKVGSVNDFYIELSNNSSYEIDISSWILSSTSKTFVFPRNSSILPKKKMILSSKVTNFDSNDEVSLKLSNHSGGIVDEYAPLPIPEKPKASTEAPKVRREVPNQNLKNPELPIPTKNLAASVALASLSEEVEDSSYIYIFAFIVLIGMSGGAVYFIRKQKEASKTEDNFDMLDE